MLRQCVKQWATQQGRTQAAWLSEAKTLHIGTLRTCAGAAEQAKDGGGKEKAKQSLLKGLLSTVKSIITSRLFLFGGGAAALIAANVQTEQQLEQYYENNVLQRLRDGFCPGPTPELGPAEHLEREQPLQRLSTMLMKDQPSKFYYSLEGPSGCGKSTLIKELCQRYGRHGIGYVEVEPHPSDFGHALGTAIGFSFHQHKSLINTLLPVLGVPTDVGDNTSMAHLKQTVRTLAKAARKYKQEVGRPFVLFIDQTDRLAENDPELLMVLQDFAREWAEQLILSVVFVSSEKTTQHLLNARPAWAYAYQPDALSNISDGEALSFLLAKGIAASDAKQLVQVCGGAFHRLEKACLLLRQGLSVPAIRQSLLLDLEAHYTHIGVLDETPQQKPGLRVIRELLHSEHTGPFRARRAEARLPAAEFRRLVPTKDMQDSLLASSVVLTFDGNHVRFASRTAALYAREILPGKVQTGLKL